MATLEKIRNKGVFLAVVIGLALLAFILSDFIGKGKGLFSSNEYEVAEIAGKSIPYQHYQGKVEYLTEINKMFSGKMSLDEQALESIKEQAWQQIVKNNILTDEYKELGIIVSTAEIADMVWGSNIHPFIRQTFANPKTGEVDPADVKRFIQSLDEDPSGQRRQYWTYLESELITERAFTKYNTLIKKGMFATDLEAKENFIASNKLVDFSFVVKRYNTVVDSTITVSEKEINTYYNNNSDNYKQSASRDIEYVIFPINPSQEDNEMAEKWINNIKQDFIDSKESMEFANINSDVPNPNINYSKEALPLTLKDLMFDAEQGFVYGPYFENSSYKLAKLVDVKNLSDSVKVRHILIAPQSADKTIAQAKADSILNAIKGGANFAEMAKKFSKDPASAPDGGDLGWFKDGVMPLELSEASFIGKKGDITLVEANYGFHVIEILDQSPKSRKVNIAVIERKVIASTKTRQTVYAEASKFAGTNTTIEAFNTVAAEKNYTKRVANNINESEKRISGLENPRDMIRWAYKAELNNVSEVYEFGDNYVVAALDNIKEEGPAPLSTVKDQIEFKVRQDKKAEKLIEDAKAYANAKSIEEIASKENTQVIEATDIAFNAYALPSAGIEPAIIATALNTAKGTISAPVKGNNGVYIIQVNNIKEVTVPTELSGEARNILQMLESRENYEAFAALKKAAKIVDKRGKFY